ncbi:MAG: hypothetical protein HFJ31_01140 [Clostridia bacterium]|nr:hypothetical protein [Clostridia bacterium]
MDKTYDLYIEITDSMTLDSIFSADLCDVSKETIDKIQRVIMEASQPT